MILYFRILMATCEDNVIVGIGLTWIFTELYIIKLYFNLNLSRFDVPFKCFNIQ